MLCGCGNRDSHEIILSFPSTTDRSGYQGHQCVPDLPALPGEPPSKQGFLHKTVTAPGEIGATGITCFAACQIDTGRQFHKYHGSDELTSRAIKTR